MLSFDKTVQCWILILILKRYLWEKPWDFQKISLFCCFWTTVKLLLQLHLLQIAKLGFGITYQASAQITKPLTHQLSPKFDDSVQLREL